MEIVLKLWLKPVWLSYPPHKWDGNEFCIFYSLPFGFSQRLIWNGLMALAANLYCFNFKSDFPGVVGWGLPDLYSFIRIKPHLVALFDIESFIKLRYITKRAVHP